MNRNLLTAAMTLFFAAGLGYAAEPEGKAAGELGELVTDRPDFTESSEVVGRGVVQYEMGGIFEMDREAGARTLSLGTPLMRWGVGKRWEMRVAGDGFLTEFAGKSRRKGIADTEFGFKYKLRDESKWAPAVGVIPFVGMPTGVAAFTGGRMDPGFKLTWAKDAPLGFSLSGNLNAARITGTDGRFLQKAVTFSVGHDLVAGLGGYWEAFAFAPFDTGTGPNWIFDTGVTGGVGSNAQWDITWGHRLNQIGPEYFVQAGFSFRHQVEPFRW